MQQNGLPQIPSPPISDADLAQLDPCAEHACQILYERAEVNPSVGGEVENYLAVVKGVFHVYELHLKPVSGNFLLTDFARFLFLYMVFREVVEVFFGGYADEGLERMSKVFLADLLVCHRYLAALQSARGFNNNHIPDL